MSFFLRCFRILYFSILSRWERRSFNNYINNYKINWRHLTLKLCAENTNFAKWGWRNLLWWFEWCDVNIFETLFFSIIYSIPILQFRHRAYTIRVKIAKAELTVIFFLFMHFCVREIFRASDIPRRDFGALHFMLCLYDSVLHLLANEKWKA